MTTWSYDPNMLCTVLLENNILSMHCCEILVKSCSEKFGTVHKKKPTMESLLNSIAVKLLWILFKTFQNSYSIGNLWLAASAETATGGVL